MAASRDVQHLDRQEPDPPQGWIGPRVVLDNVRSAFNVGAIFRTCEAAGVAHLHLCGISAAPPNPRVLKTSLGAERSLPWSHHISAEAVAGNLRAAGVTLVAVEVTQRSLPYTALTYPPEVAFIFGHEVAGIAEPLLAQADMVIEIPMLGRKNSLNVATSVGIVLFEVVRQRLRRNTGTQEAAPRKNRR
ncbi:MAG: RNA methyltransferase [Candidatus Eisenbacteria sp.]|nr:RNA methyltransferase [Candidatus Eisenbacteria bacterium]